MSPRLFRRVLRYTCLAVAYAAVVCCWFAAPSHVWGLTADDPAPEPTPLWLGDRGVDVEAARGRRHEAVAAWLHWEQATTVGDYQRTGTKDTRWDADASACLEAYAQALVRSPEDGKAFIAAAKAAAQRALASGCTDPLVRYAALRVAATQYPGSMPDEARRYAQAEAELEKSDYAAVRKCYASFRAAVTAADAGRYANPKGKSLPSVAGTDAAASLDRTFKHFVEVVGDPAVPHQGLFELADSILNFAENNDLGEAKVFAPLEAAFATGALKDAPETASLRMTEGLFWIHYGWRARTSKWASEVTDEGWRLFGERLLKAQAALEKAYELDPTEPRVCGAMMTVELGQGEDREQMETWFRRAMDADPDNLDACEKKMYYLEPKWHGSQEDMLDFGRECLATRNWTSRLPWLLEKAHKEFARELLTASADDYNAYWKQPAVWNDIHGLYEAALKAHPDSVTVRSAYAGAAYQAQQWKLADALFTELGDKADLHALDRGPKAYEQIRHEAAERARGDQ